MTLKNFALLFSSLFLTLLVVLRILYNPSSIDVENFSMLVIFMALIIAIFSFNNHETFNERLEIFLKGSTQSIIVHACYIFFLTTIFTKILQHTGSITSAVNVCLHVFPTWCILPGIFLSASLVTFTIGSSIGAIGAFTPVAINIAHHLGINPSLMAATIICGCVFGDNLSILSETSIISVKITDTTMAKKFYLNMIIGLPACIITLMLLMYQNSFMQGCGHLHNFYDLHPIEIIKSLPYTITFCLALTGLDMIFVIIIGIISAIALGLFYNNFTLNTITDCMFEALHHAQDALYLFIIIILLSGLIMIMNHNGSIDYVIKNIKNKISNTRHAKFVMFFLIVLVNIIIAIHSVAIIICGPTIHKIGHECHIDPAETACILGIVSSTLQGSLPYAPQLVLAASIAQVSTLSLLPYLYYQYLLLFSLGILLCRNGQNCIPKS